MIAISVERPRVLNIQTDDAIPSPGPGELLVKIARAGICGSDVHILQGSNPFARYPRIIGHEMAGIVVAAGEGVTEPAIGQHVVVDPVISCGTCHACRIGRTNVCANLEVMGVHRDGGFRSYLVVPAANAIAISPDLPFGIAALAEPFSIAANVLGLTGCRPDDSVLVYGAGPIGLTVLQVVKLKGARCIVADIDPARLEAAQAFGADRVVPATPGAVPEAVASESDGLGPTVVIDAAGAPALLSEAASVISPAGRIGLLGFSATPAPVSEKDIVSKEVAIYGSRLSRKLLPEVVGWLESGLLQPAAMIRDTLAAEDAEAAFALISDRPSDTIKVQLAF